MDEFKVKCLEAVGGYDINDANKPRFFFKGKKYKCKKITENDEDIYIISNDRGSIKVYENQFKIFFEIIKK